MLIYLLKPSQAVNNYNEKYQGAYGGRGEGGRGEEEKREGREGRESIRESPCALWSTMLFFF